MTLLKSIKKSIAMFIISMLITTSIFSQSALTKSNSTQYPIKQVLKGDTVFILSQEQFLKVNLSFVKQDELKEINSNLKVQNNLYQNEIKKLEETDSILIKNIALKDEMLFNKDSIILIKDNMLIEKDKQVRNLKWQRNTIGGIGVIIILLIILL